MNPILHDGAIPTTPISVSGLDLLLLFTVVSLFAMVAMMLWSVRDMNRERRRLFCPVRLRSVRVLFRLAPNGTRTDVLRCSVFGRRPITCGKLCLHHPSPA
jgi:hypothetical protein